MDILFEQAHGLGNEYIKINFNENPIEMIPKMEITFDKLHGLGNDYIYINLDEHPLQDIPEFAKTYSPRRIGIGGDGVVTYNREPSGNYLMRIFNQDGSEGMMCGNAIRCVAKLLYERGLCRKNPMTINTQSGEKVLSLVISNGIVTDAKVDMGCPKIYDPHKTIDDIEGVWVSIGNPHFVHFIETDPNDYPLETIGPKIEHSPIFEGGINYEVARITDKHNIEMRVWERGSGLTMACGTGATATGVAAIRLGIVDSPVKVSMPGGSLVIDWGGSETLSAFMTGPATYVFQGKVNV